MNGNDEPFDWIARAATRAKGRRPEYFDDPAIDRLLSVVLALTGEVSALRERIDTIERLLEAKGALSRDEIERYAPDRVSGEERGLATQAFISRVMRAFQQELEAMQNPDPPIMEWVERLGRE